MATDDLHVVLTQDLAQGATLTTALRDWENATGHIPGGHRVIAADITIVSEANASQATLRLSNRQAERLAHLLNTDTAIITAHAEATGSAA